MKKLKILLLILFGYLSLDYIYTYYIANFRFEKFSNYEEIKNYLDKNYIGKDANELKALMEKAGAKCELAQAETWKNWSSKYANSKLCYYCNYTSSLLGINSLKSYGMDILVDDNNKILAISGIVHSSIFY